MQGAGNPTGSVTVVTPPTSSETLSIFRVVPATQEADFVANDPFPAETFEDSLDKITMIVGQAVTDVGRSLKLFDGDTDGSGRYNANGNRIVGLDDGVAASDAATVGQLIGAGSGNFIQAGAGSVTRTMQNKVRESVSVKDFGAVGDGATNDTAAIANAIASLGANGGIVLFPRGTYRTTAIIEIGNGSAASPSTTQNIYLRGEGLSGTSSQVAGPFEKASVKIIYDGTPGAAAVIRINGPIVCGIEGMHIDCNFKADRGLLVSHAYQSNFKHIYIGKHSVTGIRLTALRTPVNCFIGANDNVWENVHVAEPGAVTASGIDIGESTAAPGELDVARNEFRTCSFKYPNNVAASGVILRFCDIINFFNCFFYTGATLGAEVAPPVRVIAPTGNLIFPSEIGFYMCPMIGANVYDAAWVPASNRGLSFWPYNTADVETRPDPIPSRAAGGIFGVTTGGDFFDRFQLSTFRGQNKYRIPTSLFRDVTRAAVTNSTTQTTLATFTLPGGALGTDGVLRLIGSGNYFNNSGGSSTLKLTVDIDGAPVLDTGTYSVVTDAGFRAVTFDCTIVGKNSATAQSSSAKAEIGGSISVGGTARAVLASFNQSRDDLAVPSASDRVITVKVQHGTANANITFALDHFFIELI